MKKVIHLEAEKDLFDEKGNRVLAVIDTKDLKLGDELEVHVTGIRQRYVLDPFCFAPWSEDE